MYQLEKIGDNSYYFKAIGIFPPSIAEAAFKEFKSEIDGKDKFSIIIDLTDGILVSLKSINPIIEFFKSNEMKLVKSAVIIGVNPPLDAEMAYILEKVNSPKRKIVKSLDEAKEWVGIDEIIIKRNE